MWKRNHVTLLSLTGKANQLEYPELHSQWKQIIPATQWVIFLHLLENHSVFKLYLQTELRSAKFTRISWTCFGKDSTYLHVDITDKLVLKLLQYAGNHAGELLQRSKISHRFGSDDVSVGRYQRSEPGNSTVHERRRPLCSCIYVFFIPLFHGHVVFPHISLSFVSPVFPCLSLCLWLCFLTLALLSLCTPSHYQQSAHLSAI